MTSAEPSWSAETTLARASEYEFIRQERAGAGARLHENLVSRGSQFGDRVRHERDSALGRPGLLDHGNLHGGPHYAGSHDAAAGPVGGGLLARWPQLPKYGPYRLDECLEASRDAAVQGVRLSRSSRRSLPPAPRSGGLGVRPGQGIWQSGRMTESESAQSGLGSRADGDDALAARLLAAQN